MGHIYNWKRDSYDDRDYMYGAMYQISSKLPVRVDLTPWCSPVENQGDLGSCTANALVGAMEYLEIKNKKEFKNLSRLFVYFNERDYEGDIGEDTGALIKDGIRVLADKGVCPEDEWPYDISKFRERPHDQCYKDALNRQIISYQRILTLAEMKSCLASGFPFVFGFEVFEDFETERMAKTGIMYMPRAGEQCLGGHAVLAVGYNDQVQRIIVRNSWGSQWGKGGYFSMPYTYITNPKLADDMWVIKTQEFPEVK